MDSPTGTAHQSSSTTTVSIDAWFASPGGEGEDHSHQWDWIRHRSSNDGGHTWSKETVVLKPTAGSRDRQSVCDPGLIKLGEFYYLGVTAVEDAKGMDNEVFVARSKFVTGPFEKWNGKQWGGSPQPILPFRDPKDVWGRGEPSFVRKDDTLFIYFTETSRAPDGKKTSCTRVATAPAEDPDWPAKLTVADACFKREDGEDSADVKLDLASGRFLAVTTSHRMFPGSYINVRWSDDGKIFGNPAKLTGPVMTRCHNIGISGNALGQIDRRMKNFISYAYGDGTRPAPSWAYWHTYLNPITFEN